MRVILILLVVNLLWPSDALAVRACYMRGKAIISRILATPMSELKRGVAAITTRMPSSEYRITRNTIDHLKGEYIRNPNAPIKLVSGGHIANDLERIISYAYDGGVRSFRASRTRSYRAGNNRVEEYKWVDGSVFRVETLPNGVKRYHLPMDLYTSSERKMLSRTADRTNHPIVKSTFPTSWSEQDISDAIKFIIETTPERNKKDGGLTWEGVYKGVRIIVGASSDKEIKTAYPTYFQ